GKRNQGLLEAIFVYILVTEVHCKYIFLYFFFFLTHFSTHLVLPEGAEGDPWRYLTGCPG
uniref:Uncharacterized protein n=1 Tax=Nothoprocta perdicaria TaxID=30464 RepID=A0A8C6YHY2_NOTPE